MPRLNSLIALLTLVVSVQAQEIFPGPIMRTIGGTACATSDTSLPHDELLEGFQTATTGYENTWAETGTTANITAAADSTALTSGKPAGACNQAWKLVVPTDGTETYTQWNRGSSINPTTQAATFTFYVYIETPPDNGEVFYIFSLGSVTSPATAVARISLRNTTGTITLTAVGSSSSADVTVTTGAWHKVATYIDTSTTGNLSTLTIDGGAANGFNRNTTAMQYLSLGATSSLEANDSGTLWFDLVCLNTP